MNTIQLVGRLTHDPELIETSNDTTLCTMRLAVPRPRNREKTDYFDITAWATLGDVCAEHLERGRRIGVTGRIEYREWENDDGDKRDSYTVVAADVEFLSWGEDEERGSSKRSGGSSKGSGRAKSSTRAKSTGRRRREPAAA